MICDSFPLEVRATKGVTDRTEDLKWKTPLIFPLEVRGIEGVTDLLV